MLKQCLITLFGGQIGPRYNVLVDAYGPVDLTTTPEKAAQGKVGFDRLVVDPHHLQEVLERLVCLLIE